MIKMSRRQNENARKLRAVEKHRSRILSELLRIRAMLRGSYALVHTKCGKDNCWCKEGKGHGHARLSWSEKGRGMTRKVPRNQIAWVEEVTDRYRHFRSLRRKLTDLAAETEQFLDAHQMELIERTRSYKLFLTSQGQNRRKNSPEVPKKQNGRKSEIT